MEKTDKIKQLKNIIDSSKRIVFFGGAGVSTASGIPDFRGANGIYNYTPEEIISNGFFNKHTTDFFNFYSKKLVYPDAKPNLCHTWCVELEKSGKLQAIVTQNIDGLHQKAGSKVVIELHGSVLRNYCTKCNKSYNISEMDFKKPYCIDCGGLIKPDVVLYGEGLDEKNIVSAINCISSCDTLIIVGTSLVVNPAASLVQYYRGKNLVLINFDKTPYDSRCNLVINENIIEVIKKLKQLGE